jgi:hypothetical protein
MKAIQWKKLGIRESAAAVCVHLKSRGIEASLVGGAGGRAFGIHGF